MLVGSTLDLDALEVRAITLPATARPDTRRGARQPRDFMLVKEGKLWRHARRRDAACSARASVALALPGDRVVVSNVGGTPATYYLFTYRSRAPMDLDARASGGRLVHAGLTELTEKPTAVGLRRDVLNRPTAMFKRFESHWSSVKEGRAQSRDAHASGRRVHDDDEGATCSC